MTYTTDKRHPTLAGGWSYHIFRADDDRDTPRFSDPDNGVHASQIILIGELQASESA